MEINESKKLCKKKLHQYSGKQCQECRKVTSREERKRNAAQYAKRASEWYSENRELSLRRSKKWRETHPDYARINSAKQRQERPLEFRLWQYKGGAKSRGIIYDLPDALFYDLITDVCYYCHASVDPLNGIDRVDNRLGYVYGNVVSCCARCNRAKDTMTVYQFIGWATNLVKVSSDLLK
jgi:hypothetical protein